MSPDTGTKTLYTQVFLGLELPVIVGRRVSEAVIGLAILVISFALRSASGADGNTILVRGEGGAFAITKPDAITFIGQSKAAIAVFGSKDSTKGYLELNDADGSIMVEAGSLASHKGYVLANPYKASTALTGDPSVIRGGGR